MVGVCLARGRIFSPGNAGRDARRGGVHSGGIVSIGTLRVESSIAWATIASPLCTLFFHAGSFAHLDLAAAAHILGSPGLRRRSPQYGAMVLRLRSRKRLQSGSAGAVWVGLIGHLLRPVERSISRPGAPHTCNLLLIPALPSPAGLLITMRRPAFGNLEFLRPQRDINMNPLRIPGAGSAHLASIRIFRHVSATVGITGERRPPQAMERRVRESLWFRWHFWSCCRRIWGSCPRWGGRARALLLPVLPLVILVMVSTLWRRYAMAHGCRPGCNRVRRRFIHPVPVRLRHGRQPGYRDYVLMHQEAVVSTLAVSATKC